MQEESVNHIFNLSAFFLIYFTGAKWKYHAIYKAFTNLHQLQVVKMIFFKCFSNLYVQRKEEWQKTGQILQKIWKKSSSVELIELVFCIPASTHMFFKAFLNTNKFLTSFFFLWPLIWTHIFLMHQLSVLMEYVNGL